jgi:hypothetical protein
LACLARLAFAFLLLLSAFPAVALDPVKGKTPWAIVLCKFSDVPDEPFTVKDAEIAFTEAGQGQGTMFDYWKDMSFGNVDLTGSKVFGWFDLPLTFDEYDKLGGEQPFGRPKKFQACVDASRGVPYSDFYGTIVVWNDVRGQVWGELKKVALSADAIFPGIAAHEMGHGYGMHHSRGGVPAVEYGDGWDIMSFGNVYSFAGPAGRSGPGLNASYRAMHGWLDPKRITEVARGNKVVVRLDSLSIAAGSDMHMARVQIAPDEYLEVELRTPDGWDRGIPGPAVLVHRVGAWPVTILQANDPANADLQAGERYYHAAADVQFRVLAIDAGAAQADVEIGPTSPVARATVVPAANPSGWHTTNVEVLVDTFQPVPRYAPTLITFELEGAQQTPAYTVSAFAANVSLRTEGLTSVRFTTVDINGNEGDQGLLDIKIDKTAPTTTATLVPTPAGFAVRIAASDATSGVREIRYNIGGYGPDQVSPGSEKTVLLSPSGWSTLLYWAIDNAGNVETYHMLTVAPMLEVSPPVVNLTAPVGAYGAPGFVTLRNSGLASMNIVSAVTDSYYFRVVPGSSCVGLLPGGATCQLAVDFYAPAAFAYDATLYIRTDDIHHLDHYVALHGEGKVPGLTFNPDPVAFADVGFGTVGGSYARVTIGNTSGAPVVISNTYTSTSAFRQFTTSCGPKPYTLASGATCYVDLFFFPTGVGVHADALQVIANVPGGSRSVSLRGVGTGVPLLVATPNPVAFGAVSVGQSRAVKMTIQNNGAFPAFVNAFTIAGPDAAMFRVIKAQCPNGVAPTSIEPRHTCELQVAYTPAGSGTHQAVLRTDLSMAGGPFDVPIGGSAP